jgi:ubiquinone/menaquinone biosynthesis C-methylase UbiE
MGMARERGKTQILYLMSKSAEIFDEWPDKYDQWFTTPIGLLVRKYESELIVDCVQPGPGELILDAGCGTGIFTLDLLSAGSRVVGLDISFPMLRRAREKQEGHPFSPVWGDIPALPFRAETFDKVVSVTAIEFVEDGKRAVAEMFRVVKRGGIVVVASLNSLSPWATRRKAEGQKGHAIFRSAIFRSPDELASLAPVKGRVKTAIHFLKDDSPERAIEAEHEGRGQGLDTGAFAVSRWIKT